MVSPSYNKRILIMYLRHALLPAIVLTGVDSSVLLAQSDPCAALGNSYVTVQAAPLANATVFRVPWQGGPAQEPANLRITVAQESGDVLTGGIQPAATVAFVASAAGGPAIDVTIEHEARARFPLAGTKTVKAEWSEGDNTKTFCNRVRVLARQPANLTSEWVVDGQAQPYLPATVSSASAIRLRVSGQGLWQDIRLELDKRLSDQGVALAAPTPVLVTSAGSDVALFNVRPVPASGLTGARYSLSLQNEGWATPGNLGVVTLPSVEVYGRPPRLLANEGDGEYRVPSNALAPTTTLRGLHLGFEAERLDVNITAHHSDGTTTLQPITKVLAPCATDAKINCLTISFSRPVPGVQRYAVVATTFDKQSTNEVNITPSTTRFEFTKIESETGVTNKQAVFAGRTANLTITLPASSPAGIPDSVTLDGRRIANATFSNAPGILHLTLPVPALPGSIDRVTRTLAVVYPDFTTGVGTLSVYRVPELTGPVVIYGLKPYAVRIGGEFLSDVSIGDGPQVKVQDVTVGPSAVLATFTSNAAGTFSEALPVTRLGERVGVLQVTVLSRLPLSQVARWGTTDAPTCSETNLPLQTDLEVPTGGALCIRIESDSRNLALDVQDTVAINVLQGDKAIGSEVRLGYRAAHGSQFFRLPLTGVEQGTRVTVGVQPTTTEAQQPAQGEARTRLGRKERIGLFASVTAFAFRVRSEEARAAEEAALTETATDLAGQVGIFYRPLPANRDYTLFVGVQRLTRRFCQGLSNNELGVGVGLSIHSLFSIGAGIPLESSETPTTCEDLPDGESRPTVNTRGFYIMLGAPVLKLFSW